MDYLSYYKGWPSYYSVLGVGTESSDEEIRRAYRKLAMQWHPDKWSTRNPSLVGEAKQRFQEIQEAYSVLSDKGKRALYDAGLYDPDEEVEEGYSDFVQEMVSLMKDVRKEEKSCSIEELQSMLWEMAEGFEIPEWTGTNSSSNTNGQREHQWPFGSSVNSNWQYPWEANMFQT